MSLDISLMQEDIDGNIECVMDKNMTHNVIPMWKKAGCYDALYNSDGRRAGEFIDILKEAEWDMRSKPDSYKKLNAENGWGTYDQAYPWLCNVFKNFEKYPSARIQVNK